MIRFIKKTLKRMLFISIFFITLIIVACVYFTQDTASLEKNTLNIKQTLEIKDTINTLSNRYHLNGQTYDLTFSEDQLQTALVFSLVQYLNTTEIYTDLTLNKNSIEIQLNHPISLYFTTRYVPITFTIELNNYQTPISQIELKHHVFGIFSLNYLNNKIVNSINEQALTNVLTTENINATTNTTQKTLTIKYTWNEAFSRLYDQQNVSIDHKISNTYATFQAELKKQGFHKLSLQDSMSVLFKLLHSLKQPEQRVVFWSTLFASVDTQKANALLNLNLAPPLVKLTLQNRYDLAKHFVYSAYLQQIGGNSFSQLIGEYKENKDATTRTTKFSYTDVMANQAGIVFSDTLINKVNNNQQSEFFNRLKISELTLSGDSFADGIEAPTRSEQAFEINTIKHALAQLPIYQ